MPRISIRIAAIWCATLFASQTSLAQPIALPALTTLSDSTIKYEVPATGYHVLEQPRG